MNVIDQAFVKAYSRRGNPQSAGSAAGRAAASGSVPGAPDLSVHPQAADSAVVWIDAIADQYLRRDNPHGAAPLAPIIADAPRAPAAKRTPGTNQHPGDEPPHPGPTDERPTSGGLNANGAGGAALQPQTIPLPSIDLSSLYHCVIAAAAPSAASGPPAVPPPAARPSVTPPAQPPQREPAAEPVSTRQRTAEPIASHPPLAEPHPQRPAPVHKPFAALWEVDAFEFSETVTALFGNPEVMQSIGSPLDRAVSEGLQSVLITSDRPRAGQTSVATGLAISAAAAGLRVALVDAATAAARGPAGSLADSLNLDIQHGWVEAIRDGISVAETAIHSIEDQLTVIPQTALRRDDAPTADEFCRMIGMLRSGFDLIVIDGPACHQAAFAAFIGHARKTEGRPAGQAAAEMTPVDAVILVQDVRSADTTAAMQLMDSLKRQGITGLGTVENFT